MQRRRWLLAAVVLVVAALGGYLVVSGNSPVDETATSSTTKASPTAHSSANASQHPGNLTLTLRPVGSGAFEPTMGIGPDGALYYQASASVLKSTDRGRSWTKVFPPTPRGVSADPFLHVDPVTGRVFSQQLLPPLTCTQLAFSDDGGETWTVNPAACGIPHNDKQNIGTAPSTLPAPRYEGRALFLCSNQGTIVTCQVSLDGGLTFPISRPVFETTQPCSLFPSPATPGPNGTVYTATATCDGRTLLGATSDTGQSWTTRTVVEDVTTTNFSPVPVAVDGAGTVYVAWVGEKGHLYYAASTDQGRSWTQPRQVESEALSSTALPTMTAGARGRISIGYLGALGGNQSFPDEAAEDVGWHLYATTIHDAQTSSPERFTDRATAQDAPVHEGPCASFDGGRCGETRDYIDIDHDARGRVYVTGVTADGQGLVGVQTAGPRFFTTSPDTHAKG